MGLIDIGALLVAVVAALGAWAAAKAAAKASKTNTEISSRLDTEKEAYVRARSFDVDTIDRQDAELKQLRTENERLRAELAEVKSRVRKLEAITPEFERLINERFGESYDQE